MGDGWLLYEVTVTRGGTSSMELMSAPSRGAAVAEAWRRWNDCWGISFRDFLDVVHCRLHAGTPPTEGYDYIRRAYGVSVKTGDRVALKNEGPKYNGRLATVVYPGRSATHVHLVLDGEAHASIVHPLSITLVDRAVAP